MDAVIDALEGITVANGYETEVEKVSESLESYEQIDKKDLPAIFPIDADEPREYAVMPDSSDLDIQAALEVIVTCVVFDRYNNTRQQRTDLMRDVGKAMLNDTALEALILYIEPMGVVTDKGTIPNFSIWDQSYRITYRFDSADGG